MKDILITQIINRLRRLGFVHVNKDNITTDEVYSHYFFNMLDEMQGENKETDKAIKHLLKKYSPPKK
jgi:hypothetical protein